MQPAPSARDPKAFSDWALRTGKMIDMDKNGDKQVSLAEKMLYELKQIAKQQPQRGPATLAGG